MPEAGWIIHPGHWGQGIAREAMAATLAWFDATHGMQRIACMIEAGHGASEALAAKLGFAVYARHVPEGETELVLYQRG